MSSTDELIAQSEYYTATFRGAALSHLPALGVAVLACMDARLNVYGLLGVAEGDVHVLRNAGGIATQDSLRSLAISQRKLETREIMIIQHTGCGMATFDDDGFRNEIAQETGVRPLWAAETFTDLDVSVRQSIARIKADSSIPRTDSVRGFVYDVGAGSLREVSAVPGPAGAGPRGVGRRRSRELQAR